VRASSIFSSETLDFASLRPHRAAVFALALAVWLAGLECGLRLAAPHIRHFYQADYPLRLGERIFQLERMRRQDKPPGLLILGDSTAEFGLVPHMLDDARDGCGGALCLAGPENARYLRRLVERLQSAFQAGQTRVVIGWTFLIFTGDAPLMRGFDQYLESFSLFRVMDDRARWIDRLALWRYRHALRRMIEEGPPILQPSEWVMRQGGWRSLDGTFETTPDASRQRQLDAIRETVTHARSSQTAVSDLRTALGRLKRAGCEVTVVLMPEHPDFDRMIPGAAEAWNNARKAAAALCDGQGARFIDGTQAPGLRREHFADLVHLNGAGAKAFSQWLASQIPRPNADPGAPTNNRTDSN